MSKPIGRIEFKFVQVLLFIQLFLFALRKYKNLKIAVKSIKNLAQHGEKLLGGKKMQKNF